MRDACKNKGYFWWKDFLSLVDLHRGLASCNVGKGDTTLLCKDLWNGNITMRKFHELHSCAYEDDISIVKAMKIEDYYNIFKFTEFI